MSQNSYSWQQTTIANSRSRGNMEIIGRTSVIPEPYPPFHRYTNVIDQPMFTVQTSKENMMEEELEDVPEESKSSFRRLVKQIIHAMEGNGKREADGEKEVD